MSQLSPQSAIDTVPPGPWAVGVSGGADSVGLLMLLSGRSDIRPHVVHLNHQTRGDENDQDVRFVAELAERLNVSHTIAIRSEVEAGMTNLPANPSARYRAARRQLFAQVVRENNFQGVILAHHADDQAETILQRLIRSSGPAGLAGMEPRAGAGDLLILRPLLSVSRDAIRAYLGDLHEPWREDPSNTSDKYLRNRLRRLLERAPHLKPALLELGAACYGVREWVFQNAPVLEEEFVGATLASVPRILAAESARCWLIARGVPRDQITPEVITRLLQMATDVATPSRGQFPGGILVRRRAKRIFVDAKKRDTPAQSRPSPL